MRETISNLRKLCLVNLLNESYFITFTCLCLVKPEHTYISPVLVHSLYYHLYYPEGYKLISFHFVTSEIVKPCQGEKESKSHSLAAGDNEGLPG